MSTDNTPQAKGFAERLTRAREAAGLSRRALARIAQVSEAHVSRLELGQRVPSPVMRHALARALGVNANWFASGRGAPRGVPDEAGDKASASHRLPAALEQLLDRERLAPEVGRLSRAYIQRYLQRVEAVRVDIDAQLETVLRDIGRRVERELADFRARLLAEWRAERRRHGGTPADEAGD